MTVHKQKNLIFTGGGSGGHVMPALTMIKKINAQNEFNIHYIGGINGIERELVKDYALTYHAIHTGKLRRYLSKENLMDMFKVVLGFFESFKVLFQFSKSNSLLFSTGGFVSVPVVIAAWIQGKKIFIHEQTSRVGLANKISSKLCDKVFVSFEDSIRFFPKEKTIFSGYPLREECYEDSIKPVAIDGRHLNSENKPILFITGGGNGSGLINKLIKNNFQTLTKEFLIIHQTGKQDFKEYETLKSDSYLPIPFIGHEMIDLYKLAKVIVSRSGAGTVCELLALGKKSIYIPLRIAQKNEQYFNALEAHKKLGSIIIEEKNLNDEEFMKAVSNFEKERKEQGERAKQNGLLHLIKEVQNAY